MGAPLWRPVRSSAQVRIYTDADVERLVLISRAQSRLSLRRSDPPRGGRAARAVDSTRTEAESERRMPTVESLLGRLLDDPRGLAQELRRSVALLGPKRFLTDVAAAPLVDKVGNASGDEAHRRASGSCQSAL